jgi:hypothetical protein
VVLCLRLFTHCLDALGTEYFANTLSIFHHTNGLQIRFEFAIGRIEGVAAAAPEERFFAAICTDCHDAPP